MPVAVVERMRMTTVNEYECVWARTAVWDGGAARKINERREAGLQDVAWQRECDELSVAVDVAFGRQAPCAVWHPARGIVSVCYAHAGQIVPVDMERMILSLREGADD